MEKHTGEHDPEEKMRSGCKKTASRSEVHSENGTHKKEYGQFLRAPSSGNLYYYPFHSKSRQLTLTWLTTPDVRPRGVEIQKLWEGIILNSFYFN